MVDCLNVVEIEQVSSDQIDMTQPAARGPISTDQGAWRGVARLGKAACRTPLRLRGG